MLTERQAAERLGLSVTTLRTWRCRHKGPSYYKMGRTVRYDELELTRYLNESLQEPVFGAIQTR